MSEFEDTIRIMIASDNHLGYCEKDPIRAKDSFAAFEEILQTAVETEVDMVLLGGDLFHENKPSRMSVFKAISLLRMYCLGNKPVEIRVVSQQDENFRNKRVNYEDPNFNVGLPVFSINGNHDDLARFPTDFFEKNREVFLFLPSYDSDKGIEAKKQKCYNPPSTICNRNFW